MLYGLMASHIAQTLMSCLSVFPCSLPSWTPKASSITSTISAVQIILNCCSCMRAKGRTQGKSAGVALHRPNQALQVERENIINHRNRDLPRLQSKYQGEGSGLETDEWVQHLQTQIPWGQAPDQDQLAQPALVAPCVSHQGDAIQVVGVGPIGHALRDHQLLLFKGR